MKKFSIIILLFCMSLLTSGCVNKLAVQDLNKKAQEYMNSGRTEDAVSRLEASIDLDNTIYETYYNLAVAYMKLDKTDKAQEALNRVLELNPDFPDAYYTMAVIYEDKAYAIINGEDKDKNSENSAEDKNDLQKKELSDGEKTEICIDFDSAIDYYNKYLVKNQNASDRDKVNEKIEQLNSELQKYGKESGEDKE